jgi:ribonuclease-3
LKSDTKAGSRPQDATDAGALSLLEASLGHTFAKPELLVRALTHSSLRHEQQQAAAGQDGGKSAGGDTSDNERLEFLGDAVVGLLVAEALFLRYPGLREGELTQLRAALVSRKYLGEVGLALELGRWLRLSRSEERSGGRKKAVLLANCVEAIAAAVYLDTGTLHAARSFVEMAIVEPRAGHLYRELRANHTIGDYKSALQEFLQAQGLREPEYLVKAETGPDHRKRFDVEVRTSATETEEGRALASGNGSTKKKAEQEAAERAYRKLVSRDAVRGKNGDRGESEPGSVATDVPQGKT